jgi:hypothetical protein
MPDGSTSSPVVSMDEQLDIARHRLAQQAEYAGTLSTWFGEAVNAELAGLLSASWVQSFHPDAAKKDIEARLRDKFSLLEKHDPFVRITRSSKAEVMSTSQTFAPTSGFFWKMANIGTTKDAEENPVLQELRADLNNYVETTALHILYRAVRSERASAENIKDRAENGLNSFLDSKLKADHGDFSARLQNGLAELSSPTLGSEPFPGDEAVSPLEHQVPGADPAPSALSRLARGFGSLYHRAKSLISGLKASTALTPVDAVETQTAGPSLHALPFHLLRDVGLHTPPLPDQPTLTSGQTLRLAIALWLDVRATRLSPSAVSVPEDLWDRNTAFDDAPVPPEIAGLIIAATPTIQPPVRTEDAPLILTEEMRVPYSTLPIALNVGGEAVPFDIVFYTPAEEEAFLQSGSLPQEPYAGDDRFVVFPTILDAAGQPLVHVPELPEHLWQGLYGQTEANADASETADTGQAASLDQLLQVLQEMVQGDLADSVNSNADPFLPGYFPATLRTSDGEVAVQIRIEDEAAEVGFWIHRTLPVAPHPTNPSARILSTVTTEDGQPLMVHADDVLLAIKKLHDSVYGPSEPDVAVDDAPAADTPPNPPLPAARPALPANAGRRTLQELYAETAAAVRQRPTTAADLLHGSNPAVMPVLDQPNLRALGGWRMAQGARAQNRWTGPA